MKNQLIEVVAKAKDKKQFMRTIDHIVSLSEKYDDNYTVDALCYLITVTEDWDVRYRALTVIDRIKRR
jgi:hypothetical protein